MAIYQDNALQITDMSIGANRAGFETYKEEIKTEMLIELTKKIDETDEISQKLNQCWRGESRHRFDSKFNAALDEVKNDIKLEYANLEARINEMASAFFKQDNEMIDE